ncbi:MAG: DegV family protein [Actinomycetia bacterium]|nr:DegV family protein [Actinomycetes bacterium]
MSKIAIVTDSTSDIPIDLVKKYEITVVPLSVVFSSEETYVDNGEDITIKQFYEKLKTVKKLPTSAQPTPNDFLETYKNLLNEGYETIISIHISQKMSGTLASALAAKKQLPDQDIEVIDSYNVHMPCGIIAVKAAQMAQQDKSKEEIMDVIYDIRKKVRTLFVPKTLEYLQKGGRIGKAKGLVASLLEIKPILTIESGEISQFKTTRRWNQAKAELINSMGKMVSKPDKLVVIVSDSDNKEEGDMLEETIKKEFNPREIIRADIGVIVGAHVGPGTINATFYEED